MSAPDPTAGEPEYKHSPEGRPEVTHGGPRSSCRLCPKAPATPDADDASEPLTEAREWVRDVLLDQRFGASITRREELVDVLACRIAREAAAATKARAGVDAVLVCPHGPRHYYTADATCQRCQMPSWVEAAVRTAMEDS